MRRFTVRNIVGEGATGVVYRAFDQNNEEVSIKMVPKSKNTGDCVQKEVNMLSRLNHENILKLVDFYETKNNSYIVTELCDSNLITFINDYNIDESVALKVLRMILCGIHHIHSKGIIHRDIKLGNLLIKGNSVKICDFGLACLAVENNNTFCGTEDYLAPEVKLRKEYDKSIDLFSTGKVFYTLLTKKKFDGYYDHGISPLCRDLLEKLMDKDPKRRIDSFNALSHPAFDVFIPIFPFFGVLNDFLLNEKFGKIEKQGNSVKFDELKISVDLKGSVCSDINVLDLSLQMKPKVLDSTIYFRYKSCTVSYTLSVQGKPQNIFLLTNTELKKINYGMAYLKLMIGRLPLLVIDGDGYKFTYLLNKNFVFSAQSFVIRRKNGKCELTEISNKADPLLKDISSHYNHDKMVLIANKCDGFYDHIYKLIFERNKNNIKGFNRRVNTHWGDDMPFPLTTNEDKLSTLFDLIVHSKELPSLFKTDVSIPLTQGANPSYVDLSILKRYKYLFLMNIGWCINNRTDFVFLFSNGEKVEIFGVKNSVVWHDKKYFINNTLPKCIKDKLNVCLLFIRKLIK